MVVTTTSSETIQLESKPFHSGGEGELYKIVSPIKYKDKCVKIYFSQFQDKKREGKLNYMIANRPSQIHYSSDFKICWVDDIIYLNGKFVGFIMPLAFSESIQLYEICTNKIKSKVNKIFHDKFDRKNPVSLENRLKLCVNIAIAIHCIHETGTYVFVDLKPQNILIDPNGRVSIVDLDSLQVAKNSNIIHHGHVATPEYTPIEGSSLNPSINYIPPTWDYFSLAVIFYEIIFGLHPYVATSLKPYEHLTTIQEAIKNGLFVFGSKSQYLKAPAQHNNFNLLPPNIKKCFVDAFDKGNSAPLLRPSAQDWGKILVEEVAKETERVNLKCPSCGTVTNVSKHKNITINCNKCNSELDIRKGKVFGYSKEKIVFQDRTVYKDRDIVKTKGATGWIITSVILFFLLIVVFASSQETIKNLENENFQIQNSFEETIASLRTEKNKFELENERLEIEIRGLKKEAQQPTTNYFGSYFPDLIKINSVRILNEKEESSYQISFRSNELTYLSPVLWISYPSNFSFPQKVEFGVKFFYPDGSLMSGVDSPEGFSYIEEVNINGANTRIALPGWGNEEKGLSWFISGDYKVEIWVNNKIRSATKFTVYPRLN